MIRIKKKTVLLIIAISLSVILNIAFIINFNKTDSKSISRDDILEDRSLSIKQGQLVDSKDDPIQLKGMSSHGLMWYPEYINYSALKTIEDYGANVFRIAMYTDQNKGYVYNKKEAKKVLLSAIEDVLATDMYAIVDWHTLKDNNPNIHIDDAKEFFEEISIRYGDNPRIIYEICNEPSGDTTWEDIKNYANTIIPIIRKHSPKAIILVGTPNHCVDIDDAIEDPLIYDNVMYTYHMYTGTSDGGYKYYLDKAKKNNIPIFVSEWGLSLEKDTHKIDFDKAKEFLDYLEANNISWVNWSLSNKDEPYSAIRPEVSKLSNWEYDELTESGKFIFKYF